MIFLYYAIFVGIPLVLTFFNFWNLFAKKQILPKVMLFLAVFVGLYFYLCYLGFNDVTNAEWNEAIMEHLLHRSISGEYLLSFAIVCAVGFLSLFILALVPAKKLSPIVAAFSIAGVLLGNILSAFYARHVWPLLFYHIKGNDMGIIINFMPYLYHLNLFVLSVHYVRKQVLAQIELSEEKSQKTCRNWLKKLYSFLNKVSHWGIFAFTCLFPLVALIEIVLILLGQGADGVIKSFTMTADWPFSKQIPPPSLPHNGHYLCTVAAGGHRKIVRPLRFGKRRGEKIIVNRQLLVSNAFEELLSEISPSLHRKIRLFYDTHGYPLSRLITTKFRADLVYILMKPLEWFFVLTLYLLTTNPEERISRQYK